MTGTATHEQVDDSLCFRCMMHAAVSCLGGGRKKIRAKHLRHGSGAETKSSFSKKLTACQHEFVFAKWVHENRGFSIQMLLVEEDGKVAGEDGHGNLSPGGMFGCVKRSISRRFTDGQQAVSIGRRIHEALTH